MLHLSTQQAAAELAAAERVDVFAIDDTVYSIPKVVDGGTLLRFLDDVAELGEAAALANLVKELLGDDAYDALVSFRGMRPEQLKEVFDLIEEYALGQIDKVLGQGKSRSQRRRLRR